MFQYAVKIVFYFLSYRSYSLLYCFNIAASTREKQDSNLGDSTKTSKPKVDKNKSVAEEFNDSFSDNEDDGKETKGMSPFCQKMRFTLAT